MSRIRTVKPEFFRHEQLQDLEAAHPGKYPMFVFEGLWCQCDKQGVFEYRPRQLKLDILPFLLFDMDDTLQILEHAGFIRVFEHERTRYGCIPTFEKHQRISGKEQQEPSKFPVPKQPLTGKRKGSTREAPEKQQGSARDQQESQEVEVEVEVELEVQKLLLPSVGGTKRKRSVATPSPVPELIEALRLGLGRYPKRETWPVILTQCEGKGINPAALATSAADWAAHGWNPANFLGALTYHLENRGTSGVVVDFEKTKREQDAQIERMTRGECADCHTEPAAGANAAASRGVPGAPVRPLGPEPRGIGGTNTERDPGVHGHDLQRRRDAAGGGAPAQVLGLQSEPVGVGAGRYCVGALQALVHRATAPRGDEGPRGKGDSAGVRSGASAPAVDTLPDIPRLAEAPR